MIYCFLMFIQISDHESRKNTNRVGTRLKQLRYICILCILKKYIYDRGVKDVMPKAVSSTPSV